MSTNKRDGKTRAQAKAMWTRGVSVTEIGRQCGIDRRTVYRWAKAGDWPRPEPEAETPTEPVKLQVLPGGKLDTRSERVSAMLTVIANLELAMAATIKNRDYRPLGSMAAAYCKLLDLFHRLQPDSPYDIASRAVELGIDMGDIAEAVTQRRGLR